MSFKLKSHLLTLVCLLGFSSLSFELIILRQLINFVGSNALITSIIMTVILLFLSVGYYIGSVISFAKRPIRKYSERLLILMLFAYIFSSSFYLIRIYLYGFYLAGIRQSLGLVFVFSLLFLSAPSVFLGFVTSVSGRFIHHFNPNYTGRFMAVDTLGSVLGSLGTTLVLMPFIGLANTILFLIIINIICFLLIAKPQRLKFHFFSILAALFLTFIYNNEKLMTGSETLVKDDAISRVEIVPVDEQDGEYRSKLMKVNGSFSSKISSKEELNFEYINFINKTFIQNMPKSEPQEILVLGAGGFTIGLNDTFHHYTYLDIEKDLQKISEKYFLNAPLSENKKFIARDAYLFLLNDKKKYDLIIVDVYSAVKSIPMNFTTENFFKLVKAHLKENAIMIANIITSPNFKSKFSKRIDNTLRKALGNTLQRSILQTYNPYAKDSVNIEYIYYNTYSDDTVYTLNKNTSFYDENFD